jgi:uncharacterized tellurite resistance protein B-like protein
LVAVLVYDFSGLSLEIPGGRFEADAAGSDEIERVGFLSLLRFLGIEGKSKAREQEPASLAEITAQLDTLPAAEARFVAAFSYLLARIAGVDLRTDDAERQAIAHRLETFAQIDAEIARLLAATAIQAADSHHASDDHLVARRFRELSEEPERIRLMRCLYAVAAADENISAAEDNEIFKIAEAIGIGRRDVVALRAEFKEHLGSLKALPSER